MNKESKFLKDCINTVAGLEVKSEAQAIAKEVVLSTIESLENEKKQLKEKLKQRDEVIDVAIKRIRGMQAISNGFGVNISSNSLNDIVCILSKYKGDNDE